MLTAQQMIARMGTAFNLGETFERNDHDRSAARVSPLLKAYADKGFKTVRIPVTWFSDDGSKSVLDDPVFMYQLDNALYYSIALGMCVILDTHHEKWLFDNYDGTETYDGKFYRLWQSIVNRYKGVAQENLAYECLNEPHGPKFGDWSIGNCTNPVALEFTKRINEKAYWAIRNLEPNRVIMVTTNASQCYSQLDKMYKTATDLPGSGKDKYLMAAVHNYEPCNFTLEWGSNDYYMKQQNPFGAQAGDIQKYFDYVSNWQKQMGGPSVITIAITEFGLGDSGTTNRRNCDLCRTWYREVAKAARTRGFLPVVWDDCGWFALCTSPPNVQWIDGLADCVLGRD